MAPATYAYDGQGRLAQTTTAAGITRYDYNGLGERIRKIERHRHRLRLRPRRSPDRRERRRRHRSSANTCGSKTCPLAVMQ
jgi:YD repeat-containing protein